MTGQFCFDMGLIMILFHLPPGKCAASNACSDMAAGDAASADQLQG